MRLVKLDGVQGRGMWAWAWGTGVSWYLRRFRILWHGAVAEALSIGELQAVGCASTVFHFDMCVTLGYCSISTLIFFFFHVNVGTWPSCSYTRRVSPLRKTPIFSPSLSHVQYGVRDMWYHSRLIIVTTVIIREQPTA